MPTIADQILLVLAAEGPLDDDQLAVRLGVRRQSINPVANRLAERHETQRVAGASGKWTNALPGQYVEPHAVAATVEGPLTEDEVKQAVKGHLEALGYDVAVAWGRAQGIDIEARHDSQPRMVIEAKGDVDSDQQQGNYFLGALGEIIQRWDDNSAVYGLALPDNRRYRGLVNRLPALARQRLNLMIFWVSRAPDGLLHVEEEQVGTQNEGCPGPTQMT